MARYNSFSLVLPVFNEQDRINYVVDYYSEIAPLIVVDNFSNDNTIEILNSLGIFPVKHKNPGSLQTPEEFRFIASLSPTSYFVMLSCSEFIPFSLFELFDEVASERKYDMVSCVVDTYTCGELIPLWGRRIKGLERRIERLFNKNEIKYEKIFIHGKFEVNNKEKVLYLPNDSKYKVVHLRNSDAESLILKHLNYAKVEAQQLFENGENFKLTKLCLLFIKETVRFLQLPLRKWNYISFRESWARLVMHSCIYWFYWELTNNRGSKFAIGKNKKLWENLINRNRGG